ncbi:hypothetical protein IWQ56_000844, partial [Coemansia nantahalensis]
MAASLCPAGGEGWGPLSPTRPVDFTPCFQYGAVVAGLNALFVVAAIARLHTLRLRPRLPAALVAGSLFWVKLSLAVAAVAASAAELAITAQESPYGSVFTIALALQTAAAGVAVRLHYREQFGSRVA